MIEKTVRSVYYPVFVRLIPSSHRTITIVLRLKRITAVKLRHISPIALLLLIPSFSYAGNPPLEILTHAKKVALGDYHGCALKDDGTVWCWGDNEAGELGDGTYRSRNFAARVDGISTATALVAGASHTCALLSNGTTQCWGNNSSGQLGIGDYAEKSAAPRIVRGVGGGFSLLSDITNLAAGYEHTCARDSRGTMFCWGKNDYGQLDDGITDSSFVPVVAMLGSKVKSIAAGGDHSCAILDGDILQCWGRNQYGQLGDGGSEPYSLPTTVNLATVYTPVFVRTNDASDTCAVLSGRSLKCWGSNVYGELGNGADDDRTLFPPIPHSNPSDVLVTTTPKLSLYPVGDVAIGYEHACAKMDDGLGNTGIRCWGYNYYGELGDGESESHSDLPTTVLAGGNPSTPLSGVMDIAVGAGGACAVLTSGIVQCWGSDENGELGIGSSTDHLGFPLFPVMQAVDEIFENGFD